MAAWCGKGISTPVPSTKSSASASKTWTVDLTFSKKTFNDLHYVYVDESGLYLCNSGLDTVEHYDREWRFLEKFPLGSGVAGEVDSTVVDYRFIPEPPGREVHPNQVIPWNGTLLVNCPLCRVVSHSTTRP